MALVCRTSEHCCLHTWVPGEALAFVTLRATMSDGDGKLPLLPARCARATGDMGGLPRSPPNREALLRRALSTHKCSVLMMSLQTSCCVLLASRHGPAGVDIRYPMSASRQTISNSVKVLGGGCCCSEAPGAGVIWHCTWGQHLGTWRRCRSAGGGGRCQGRNQAPRPLAPRR